MSSAMKGVTKALVSMNKKLNMPELQKIMADFMRENERAEFTQEAMGDAIDDAMDQEGSAADEERIVSQVMDELGITATESVPEAPMNVKANEEAEAKAGKLNHIFIIVLLNVRLFYAESDPGMSELEARLNNLRRS
jgi:charged multivesicular body protein 2A